MSQSEHAAVRAAGGGDPYGPPPGGGGWGAPPGGGGWGAPPGGGGFGPPPGGGGFGPPPGGFGAPPGGGFGPPDPFGGPPKGGGFGPPPGAIVPGAPYGVHPTLGLPYSEKSKVVAGLLQIVMPFGIGRFYTGHTSIGILQAVVTFVTCGVGALWPLVDGILMLQGKVLDSDGRPMRDGM